MSTKKSDDQKDSSHGNTDKNTDKKGSGNPMDMGMGMMKKMMGSGGAGPMAMKQKMMGEKKEGSDGSNPMQQMMGMCKDMLGSMRSTTSLAVSAQPELYPLFEAWLATREGEALAFIKERGTVDVEGLATALSMSSANATVVLTHLSHQGKVRLHAEVSPKAS